MPTINRPISIKSESDLAKMQEGGKKLGMVKDKLKDLVREGNNAFQIEDLANLMIEKFGGKPSFKMVQGYHWATCVNVNEGVVHGIPEGSLVFKNGDVVSVDLGMYYKGFHTDTSFSKLIGKDNELEEFLKVGKKALAQAIGVARKGNRIYDISKAIEKVVSGANLNTIRSLVGHGVGKALHEEPEIPCFTFGRREKSPKIVPGMALAIEVMYTKGMPDLVMADDGWTISTRDGKISALYEETVAVSQKGTKVLTA